MINMEDKPITMTIRIDKETHKRIKLFVVEHDTTIKDLFLECFESRVAKEEGEKKKQS